MGRFELKDPQTLKIKLDKNNKPLHISIDGFEIPFSCEININKDFEIEMVLRPLKIEMSQHDGTD